MSVTETEKCEHGIEEDEQCDGCAAEIAFGDYIDQLIDQRKERDYW